VAGPVVGVAVAGGEDLPVEPPPDCLGVVDLGFVGVVDLGFGVECVVGVVLGFGVECVVGVVFGAVVVGLVFAGVVFVGDVVGVLEELAGVVAEELDFELVDGEPPPLP
jgi:hypothetical protein